MSGNSDGMTLLVFVITVLLLAVSAVIGGIIWAILKAKKSNSRGFKRTVAFTLCSIFIAAASWVFNLGWIRFFMTILMIPVFHSVLLFLFSLSFAKYVDESPKMRKLNILFVASYLVCYLMLPDGGDYGGMYFFFGLVKNDILSSVAFYVSEIAFVAHIVAFVLQLVERRKIRKTMSKTQ